MQIIVTATPAEGLKFIPTPNTFWRAGQTTVEVADSDDDPPCEARTATSPGVLASDGHKIGRRTLAILRSTRGIVVQATEGANAVEATANLAEAEQAWKRERETLTGKVEQLTAEVVRLRPLESRIAEAEQTIADLRARLAKPQPPVQQQQQQKRA